MYYEIDTPANNKLDFFKNLTKSGTKTPGYIYYNGPEKNRDGTRVNSILVILARAWPSEKGRFVSINEIFNSLEIAAIVSEIYRVKGFIERSIISQVAVLNIKSGCTTVRFKLPENISIYSVSDAVIGLTKDRKYYGVSHVEGHVRGKCISTSIL